MKLSFLGGAGTVTGSKYLVESDGGRILVDCGLFQGIKALRLQNWDPFPVPPESIDAVVLTHAHLDHSGYLPKLCREGLTGPVYCTPATAALCEILLLDAAKLAEEEARYANKKGFSKHRPAQPLFTSEDAQRALARMQPRNFHTRFAMTERLSASFSVSGHILGAASVLLEGDGQRFFFSGDVGRPRDPIMLTPEPIPESDVIIVESTYGDRAHASENPEMEIRDAVLSALGAGGSILIPAFAVGRAQQLLYYLQRLRANNQIPALPIYLDSPMARSVTELYRTFADGHRLPTKDLSAVLNGVHYIRDVEESKIVQTRSDPRIVISASGMATGGRVLHYLKKMLPRKENVILFAGFQAAGTRGANLVRGADEIKIHGEYFPVRADIRNLEALSAHADASELAEWMTSSHVNPRGVFITHGEPSASDALRVRLHDRFGWNCIVPNQGQKFDFHDGEMKCV